MDQGQFDLADKSVNLKTDQLRLPSLSNRKQNEEKWTEPQTPLGHHQANRHVKGVWEEEWSGRKNILRDNGQKLPKFEEKSHQICISQKLSKFLVYIESAEAHHSQDVKSPRQHLKSSKRNDSSHTKASPATWFPRSLPLDTIQVECEVTIICQPLTVPLYWGSQRWKTEKSFSLHSSKSLTHHGLPYPVSQDWEGQKSHWQQC